MSAHVLTNRAELSFQARVCAAIEELLEATGMSQAQLGRKLGLNANTVCRSMGHSPGRRREWRAEEIARMAVVFRVPAGFFFGEDVESEWLQMVRDAKHRSERRPHAPLRAVDSLPRD